MEREVRLELDRLYGATPDNPDFRADFNLLKAPFRAHPVRIYVSGTVDSIRQITADMLYSC